MGIMNKLAFWKKDDLSDLSDLGLDKGMPNDPLAATSTSPDPFSQSPLGAEPPKLNPVGLGTGSDTGFDSISQQPTRDPFSSSQPSGANKDIELISAKIDTIRVSIENLGHKIENLNQRLAAIEAIAKNEQDTAW